ncbi:HD domain-containing protein [Virgibacillus sp. C22-A2]|uniref:HD domain-containing protein n=1 Tax=Virgibacillus tibetensis TaxID=3042313 RepID=A0ABU6KBJ9_9BACI|nr:HD domain-containing protein [Virgibacillus sp. C22-A2]
MEKRQQLAAIKNYAYKIFHNDATGHDFYHMRRVARLSQEISEEEKADPFICETSAWLHDIGDKKLFTDPRKSIEEMENFLESLHMSSEEINKVKTSIRNISFSKGAIPETIEGKIVQDADRIDAIGAIGVARTFAYGGAMNQLIHHDHEVENTSIQHFYDKLLKVKGLLHTDSAKKIAMKRHIFVEEFLVQFHNEW